MKKICLTKLKAAISGADQFQKHLIQEGVKLLMFEEAQYIKPTLMRFLLDCDIFKDEDESEDSAPKNIDAVAELSEILRKEVNKKLIKSFDWDYRGLVNNSNFFGTQRDWNTTLLPEINLLASESLILDKDKGLIKKVANTIITHPKNSFIVESFLEFTPEFREVDNFLKLGKIGDRYTVISHAGMVNENEIIIIRTNLPEGNYSEFKCSDYYSVIKIHNLHYFSNTPPHDTKAAEDIFPPKKG